MDEQIDISSESVTLGGLLSQGAQYNVPDYQRQYSWGEEQWGSLWEDINQLEETGNHFLGAIVLVEQSTGSLSGGDEFDVVDGQQRLATVSILLSLLREAFNAHGEDDFAEAINEKYIWTRNNQNEKQQTIKLNDLDNDDFLSVLNGQKASSESAIQQAVMFYEKKLTDLPVSELELLRDKILERMPVVAIRTEKEDSAFLLFETLNERGKELSSVDLMKNALFEQVRSRDTKYEPIKNGWEDTISILRYSIDDGASRFFRHYLMYTDSPTISGSVTERKLFDTFDEIVTNRIDDLDIELSDFVSDIHDKAELYSDICNAEIRMFDSKSNERINEILDAMNQFGSVQERTLYLFVFSELDNPNDVIRALHLIESFNVRHQIATTITGNKVNEFYSRLCSNMRESPTPVDLMKSRFKTRTPADEQIRVSVKQTNYTRRESTKYILKRCEQRYFRRHSGSDPDVEGEIEHIAPRRSFTAKKYSKWAEYLDVSKDEFDGYKNRLGNLTLLEERLNIEASDRPFEQKKAKYRASEFNMAQDVAKSDYWSRGRIEERTEELAEHAPTIWNFDY